MRRIDPSELESLPEPDRRELLLTNRPVAADSRRQWWSELIDRATQDALRTAKDAPDRAAEPAALAAWTIDVAEQTGDLPAADAATLATALATRLSEAAYHGRRPASLTPEAVGRRCLAAMPLTRDQINDAMEVERRYLLDSDRAWGRQPDDQDPGPAVTAMLDRLDEVRLLVQSLRSVESQIQDADLAAEVRRWTTLESTLQQGEDVRRKDREFSERLKDRT